MQRQSYSHEDQPVLNHPQLAHRFRRWGKILPRLDRFSFGAIFFLTLHLLFTGLINAPPVYALFYGNTEQWMIASFPDAAAGIPIIFLVLRAVLVVYLGVSLINVFRSVQSGEDFITVARTPVMIVAVVQLGDIIANMIIA